MYPSKNCTGVVAPTCLYVWDEMVRYGLVTNPFGIGQMLREGPNDLYEFVRHELIDEPIHEAVSVEYRTETSDHPFAPVSVIRCFPNNLLICEVKFSDHASSGEVANEPIRTFDGLGIFGNFVRRVRKSRARRMLDASIWTHLVGTLHAQDGDSPDAGIGPPGGGLFLCDRTDWNEVAQTAELRPQDQGRR